MKELVGFRREFADSQLAYLKALKNTGATLRQFTESDTLEVENIPFGLTLPPSPPPPLPPSPPPPPPFSPDLRDFSDDRKEVAQEESIEIDEDDSCTPPPPPLPSSSWEFWDPFDSSLQKSGIVEQVEEENWAETNTEFEEEDQENEVVADDIANPLPVKPQPVELVDDSLSMTSWNTKDTADMAMVIWRSKKTLAGIIKDLDDYFLKASAGGKEIAILMDISRLETSAPHNFRDNKRKRCSSSAKVFSALSWSWSSRSLQFTRDAVEFCGPGESCRPGAHCITLEKLYAEEQRLYKEVKEEEIIKLEHEKKSFLLQKQEHEDHDWAKIEKFQSIVERLQSDLICLQQSISRTCSSILKLIDEELHPQLVTLTCGLMHMWRTMYECHQVQNHISQQVNHLTDDQSMNPTTDYHRQAAIQLVTEVTSWYQSFCKLIKSQREYVQTLCRWIQLTECLVDDGQQSGCSTVIRTLGEEWKLALDRLPDKVASESIKSLMLAIHSIILQQAEEHKLQKKSDKLEKKLQKGLYSLAEMEKKLERNSATGDALPLSPKHPLSVKRVKVDALKKRADSEKAKFLNSVQVSHAMTLNNLKTSLPNVFLALTGFSSACTQTFEAIHNRAKLSVGCDGESENLS